MNVYRRWRQAIATAGLVAMASVAGCSFEVSNPGPVQDANINLAGAHQGLVNGAIRSTGDGLGNLWVPAAMVHDFMASGHTGSAGVEPEEEVGILNSERHGWEGAWGTLQRGRWVGEEAIRRFSDSDVSGVKDPNTYPLVAHAHFWAGIASRVLGEHACTAVLDGSAALPKTEFFKRAIEHFNAAEKVGRATGLNSLADAAVGARAAANLYLGNGAAARADAQKLPFTFKYTTQYTGIANDPNYHLFTAVESFAFQSMSFWGTPAHTHFLTTGDSRVAWGYDNGLSEIPAGRQYAVRGQTHPSRPTWTALVPMYYPLKGIAPRTAARELRFFEPDLTAQRKIQANLVTGREMALILAEVDLLEGNWQSAMTRINSVRTATPVYRANLATAMDLRPHPLEAADAAKAKMPVYFTGTPGDFSAGGNLKAVTATSLQEAWAALKFERYLELSLEMRRFGDRWRWRQNKTPGALHPLEYLDQLLATKYKVPTDQLNLCNPMPRGENDANDKIPSDYKDWVVP